MKIFKKSMSLLLAVIMVFGLAVTASAETTATLGVTASKTDLTVGDEFSVYLNASDDITGVFTFQMDLYYDTEMFEIVSINTKFDNKPNAKGFIRFGVLDTTSTTVIAKGSFCEVKFKVLKAGDYHFQLTTCKIGGLKDGKSDTIMNVAAAPGTVDVTAAEAPQFEGWAVSASEDKTVTVGESAEVRINVSNSDNSVAAYNAYDLTLTYDTDRLTYVSAAAADEQATVTEENGTIRVIGFGEGKNLDTPAVTLTFQAKGAGVAEVKITAAKVDIGDHAVGNDAPAATILDDTTVISVNGYTVTLGEGLSGASTVAPGADYTFTAIDAGNYDYVISATMGGETVTPNDNGDGTYTIPGVTGNLVINAAMTAKSYNVTIAGTGAANVAAADKATYNTDYTFTVTEDGNYIYTTTVTVGGNAYALGTPDENGTYTIPGTDINGDIVITVTKTPKPSTGVSVIKPDYVKGNDTANRGQDYTFTINQEEGYEYSEPTVKVGGQDVNDKVVENEDGGYTIPGTAITGDITIEVTRTAAVKVEVTEYIKLNGKSMYLVTVAGTFPEGQAAKYDGKSMFWSEKYNAYVYLVVSADGPDAVKTEAEGKVKVAGKDTADETVDYSGDVNGTKVIDVNDAQLAYDMYNAKYESFEVVSMQKFLNADVNGDKTVNTQDATAIIALIP